MMPPEASDEEPNDDVRRWATWLALGLMLLLLAMDIATGEWLQAAASACLFGTFVLLPKVIRPGVTTTLNITYWACVLGGVGLRAWLWSHRSPA